MDGMSKMLQAGAAYQDARERDKAVVRLINLLTAEEASAVTICNDDPGGEGSNNCRIDACGRWTKNRSIQFTGATRVDCLRKAHAAMIEASLGDSMSLVLRLREYARIWDGTGEPVDVALLREAANALEAAL